MRSHVLQALQDKPWQTRGELTGYEHNTALLQRLERAGLIQRRVSERKSHPFEYALIGEVNRNPPRQRLPRVPAPCKLLENPVTDLEVFIYLRDNHKAKSLPHARRKLAAQRKCACGSCRPGLRASRGKRKKLDR